MMQNKNDKVRYNGIQIPLSWQFYFPKSGDVVVPPYLIPKEEGGYAPDVVNVDRGRQLFVDDFLIEQTLISLLNSFYLYSLCKGSTYHGTNGCIHTRCISATAYHPNRSRS